MAVWVDKVAGDIIQPADPNTLADGFGATYDFTVDTTVKQLATAHAAAGAHTLKIDTGDIVAKAVTLAKMADLASGKFILGSAANLPTAVVMSGDATMDNLGAVTIGAATVTLAKMADLASGFVIIGSAVNRPGAHLLSGDATMDNAGVVTIAPAVVTLAKMADLASAKMIVGSVANRPTAVDMSGDATISNAGVVTIAADAVTNAKLANITRGSIKVGGVADAPTDLAIGAAGKFLQSNGTDPVWVSASGDATIADGGAVTIAADAVSNTKLANMTRGTIKVGGVGDAPTDLNAKAAGAFLCGDGTDVQSQVMGGDATIDAGGILTIGAERVTLAKMADLDSAHLIVGDGAQRPAAVEMSGDVTMDNAGVTTVISGSEAAKGKVELADDAEMTAGLVVQADDERLYRHFIWADQTIGGGNGVVAAALPEYAYNNPGANGAEAKVVCGFYPMELHAGCTHLHLACLSQVTVDPAPNTAEVYLYLKTIAGVTAASAHATITDFGAYGKTAIDLDISGATPATAHYIEVKLQWFSTTAVAAVAKMTDVQIFEGHV